MTVSPVVDVRTMSAAIVDAPQRSHVGRVPVPERGDGYVLVQLEGCGVCASGLPVWEGRPWFRYPLEPGAPGHEGWGKDVATGRRVALLSFHAFAEYEAVAETSLVPLPPELDDVPFPGEALGCALNVFARSGIRSGQRVAVVGAGFLGLLLVQLAVGAGAETLVFSRRSRSLELARAFGATTPDDPPDESCDVVIEATGAQEPLDLAARLCRERGRLVVAGYHQDGRRSVDMQLWNWRGLDVVNAHERDPAIRVEGMRAAVAAVVAGQLDPTPLYTHVFPLDLLDDAFGLVGTRPDGFVKALVMSR